MYKEIRICNKTYYYYDTYYTYDEAIRTAKMYRRKNHKNKYFIIQREKGFIIPMKAYDLYLTKTMRLFG